MLLAPRYQGVNLEIYPPEAPVAEPCFENGHEDRFKQALIDNADAGTFIRPVKVNLPNGRFINICQALERTDRELSQVAELCGAAVVRHAWGLYEVPKDKRELYKPYIPKASFLNLPKGHIVVAKVEIIEEQPERAPQHVLNRIDQGIVTYLHRNRHRLKLYDMKVYQFLSGQPKRPSGSPEEPSERLGDIEPLLRYRP